MCAKPDRWNLSATYKPQLHSDKETALAAATAYGGRTSPAEGKYVYEGRRYDEGWWALVHTVVEDRIVRTIAVTEQGDAAIYEHVVPCAEAGESGFEEVIKVNYLDGSDVLSSTTGWR